MSQALVIATTKYGESDLIANCLLKEKGLQSFLLRGILKSKKSGMSPAHFQPLMQLEMSVAPSKGNKEEMLYLKNVRVSYPYQTLYSDPIKQSILFFKGDPHLSF